MKLWEFTLITAANAYASTGMFSKLYARALGFLSRRAQKAHPEAAAVVNKERQKTEEIITEFDRQMDLRGYAKIEFSRDGKTIQVDNPIDTITYGNRLNAFLHRHPGFAFTGIATTHILLYLLARRFYLAPEDETFSDSFDQSLVAATPTLAFLTYQNLKEIYQNTVAFSYHQKRLQREIEKNNPPSNDTLLSNESLQLGAKKTI